MSPSGDGLVVNPHPPARSHSQLAAIYDWRLKSGFTELMANEGRIRVCASPVAKRQVRGDAESLSSFAISQKSFQVVAPEAQ